MKKPVDSSGERLVDELAEDQAEREWRPKTIDDWVLRLREKDLPIFNRTAQVVASLAVNAEASVSELAKAILTDASMTSRVLHLANSPYYNPTFRDIKTVSRAVVLLGFDTVSAIALSVAVIEDLLKGAQRRQVVREMARCFHAAVQAKSFAVSRDDESPEEVFIATLLSRLGKIAFWCFCSARQATLLRVELRRPGMTPEQAETRVLGFPLTRLTLKLCEEWKLTDLLTELLQANAGSRNRRAGYVQAAYRFAEDVEKGWDSPVLTADIRDVSNLIGRSEGETRHLLRANTVKAAETAFHYGAREASRLIPLPPEGSVTVPKLELEATVPASHEAPYMERDPLLQLEILRDLSKMLTEEKTTPDLVLSTVLEGIFRGVGMDRVLFALLSPDRKLLRVKLCLKWAQEGDSDWVKTIPVDEPLTIFGHVLKVKRAIWVTADPPEPIARVLAEGNLSAFSRPGFFLMPVVVNHQSIGVIYADRRSSRRELDELSFESFKHFVFQANLSLSYMVARSQEPA